MTDNSPRAFPRPATLYPTNAIHSREQDGMSLRDYFAAKAMEQVDWSNTGVIAGAETCYELADAMLKARSA